MKKPTSVIFDLISMDVYISVYAAEKIGLQDGDCVWFYFDPFVKTHFITIGDGGFMVVRNKKGFKIYDKYLVKKVLNDIGARYYCKFFIGQGNGVYYPLIKKSHDNKTKRVF